MACGSGRLGGAAGRTRGHASSGSGGVESEGQQSARMSAVVRGSVGACCWVPAGVILSWDSECCGVVPGTAVPLALQEGAWWADPIMQQLGLKEAYKLPWEAGSTWKRLYGGRT